MGRYEEAVAYLLEIPRFAPKTTHENLRRYLRRLGNPETQIPSVHVAGTNGKGSVCSYLAAILQQAGYRTGLFTSPHLVKLNERFQIDGKPIDDASFAAIFEQVLQAVEAGLREGQAHPNFFEFLFLMAVCWFRREGVGYAIYETGLGGRLDATNILQPELTILTAIGMDHMQYLGDTLQEIAGEKAGILKAGVPCVYRRAEDVSAEVIETRGRELGCPLFPVEKDRITIDKIGEDVIAFSYWSRYDNTNGACHTYEIKKTALYQLENAALAIEAAHRLPGCREEAVRRGVAAMRWPGRMEELESGIYIDGAHNEPAIQAFCDTVSRLYRDKKIVLLFAVASDKQYNKMIGILCRELRYESIIVTVIEGKRKTSADQIAELFRQHTDAPVQTEPDAGRALEQARRYAAADCSVFCVGSLYLAGSLKAQEGGSGHD